MKSMLMHLITRIPNSVEPLEADFCAASRTRSRGRSIIKPNHSDGLSGCSRPISTYIRATAHASGFPCQPCPNSRRQHGADIHATTVCQSSFFPSPSLYFSLSFTRSRRNQLVGIGGLHWETEHSITTVREKERESQGEARVNNS